MLKGVRNLGIFRLIYPLLLSVFLLVLLLFSIQFFKLQKFENITPAPTTVSDIRFPVETLDLRETFWEYNTFSGSITNNGKKDIFKIKVRLVVSKTRDKWDPEEQFLVIPYKVDVSKTIRFSENVNSAGSNDPWWTSNIVDAKYYNGEKVPPLPSVSPTPVINQITDNTSWGIARQIGPHTWTMKLGQDERIGTPTEIFNALNNYRRVQGKETLTWDDNLASFAQSRASHLNSIRYTDEHKGFIEYTQNIDNLKKLGFWGLGENCNYGQRLLAVHLIEWVYAGDKPHDSNQLDPTWTHVGIGVDGLGVSIVFGKWKL